MHPYDEDSLIEALINLRYLTFEVNVDEIETFLEDEFANINPCVAKRMIKVAGKISTGVTPKFNTKGVHWKHNIIENWIRDSET